MYMLMYICFFVKRGLISSVDAKKTALWDCTFLSCFVNYSCGSSRSKLLAGATSPNFAPAVNKTAGVGIPFLPVAVRSHTVPALSKTYVPARWRDSAVLISAPSGTAETSAEIAFLKLNPKPRKISAEGNPCFCPPDISAKWMSAVNSG